MINTTTSFHQLKNMWNFSGDFGWRVVLWLKNHRFFLDFTRRRWALMYNTYKGKGSPARAGSATSEIFQTNPAFLWESFPYIVIQSLTLFLDSCKLFVKERKTTPINHSAGRVEWKWVGRVNSDWWAVKKTTDFDKWGYHLNENADDWTWKIQNLFFEKSGAAPKEELISLDCKCR